MFSFSILFASEITFGGGYTKVSLQEGNRSVILTDGAYVNTKDIQLTADSIELSGDDYNQLKCKGKVKIIESARGISMSCPIISYDRSTEEIIADGWVEIDDTEHEVRLSGAWLEYDKNASVMTLQIQAKIVKETSSGLMTCNADSITYNANEQTVTLKGGAKVVWGSDTYKASIIIVNLESEEVTLHGTITGEVNG